ncbi:hypothetical protein MSG28_002848 [Choristoneura fumiferana]|uniref:Uncharacterized protein n=1 Tax=Choristoneura fumiferana TaxID=7141 RepID=A0ACC0JJG6_CHOFU|nr:hypothetical protein MSG28_002848 [Choristoneura fumiferana]
MPTTKSTKTRTKYDIDQRDNTPVHYMDIIRSGLGHYEQRRDDRDLLPQIHRLLEDLSDYIRRPPPPPQQPIYIPYPIQLPAPQCCKCCKTEPNPPNVTTRWPDMEDKRQNWGYDDTDEVEENYGINARPIDFNRIPPPSSTARTPPKVNHGTEQGAQSPTRKLRRCDAPVLSCCNSNDSRQQQQKCFALSGCGDYFEQQDVCSAEHVQEVFDIIMAAYSPTKN